MLAYKVVKLRGTNDEPIMVSLVARAGACVIYKFDETARPPDWLEKKKHGLFAYASVRDALACCKRIDSDEAILECVAGDQWPLPPNISWGNLCSRDYYPHSNDEKFPPHTMTFSSLQPIRMVSRGEISTAMAEL